MKAGGAGMAGEQQQAAGADRCVGVGRGSSVGSHGADLKFVLNLTSKRASTHGFSRVSIFSGMKSVAGLKQKNKFILLTLGIWTAWLLMAYFMMKALPATAGLDLADALFFMVAGSFGMIVPTQGGLGAYHLTSKYGFIALGLDGALGLTFAWISWVGKTIVEFVVGSIGFIIVDQRSKNKQDAVSS